MRGDRPGGMTAKVSFSTSGRASSMERGGRAPKKTDTGGETLNLADGE